MSLSAEILRLNSHYVIWPKVNLLNVIWPKVNWLNVIWPKINWLNVIWLKVNWLNVIWPKFSYLNSQFNWRKNYWFGKQTEALLVWPSDVSISRRCHYCVGQMMFDQLTFGQMMLDKLTFGQMMFDQLTFGQMTHLMVSNMTNIGLD